MTVVAECRPRSKPTRAAFPTALVAPRRRHAGPAQLLQGLQEPCHARLPFPIVSRAHEHADAPYPLRLLHARRERPGHRAADNRDELPPLHCTPLSTTLG